MYAAIDVQNRYKQQGVLTANPIELIVMLYEGCIKRLRMAALAMSDQQFGAMERSLMRAQEILLELVNCLDLKYEIANSLMDLYSFLITEITRIGEEKKPDGIEDIIEILSSLKEAWSEIKDQGRGYELEG